MNLVCADISVFEDEWSKNREEREREKRGERETDRQTESVCECVRTTKKAQEWFFVQGAYDLGDLQCLRDERSA